MYRNTQNMVEPNFQMFIKYFLIFLHFYLYWSKPKENFQLEKSLLFCVIKTGNKFLLGILRLLTQKKTNSFAQVLTRNNQFPFNPQNLSQHSKYYIAFSSISSVNIKANQTQTSKDIYGSSSCSVLSIQHMKFHLKVTNIEFQLILDSILVRLKQTFLKYKLTFTYSLKRPCSSAM